MLYIVVSGNRVVGLVDGIPADSKTKEGSQESRERD
jgi:hypothetical protein